MSSFLYITGPVGVTPAKVFRLDPVSGISTEITGFSDPTRLFLSRQNELYVLDGSNLYSVDPDQPAGSAPIATPSHNVDNITYDDGLDKIIGVDTSTRTVYLWNRNLASDPITLQWPPGPTFSGRLSITISRADGSLWMTGKTSPAIYRFTGLSQSSLTLTDAIDVAPGTNQVGLNVSKSGHLFFSSNGALRDMVQDVEGRWAPSLASDFAGLPAGPHFYLSRSRSNFDAATMAVPGWDNLTDPEVLPGIPDCYANCDGSTSVPVLNVLDFVCFQNQFASGDPQANCDDSTSPPTLNVLDFVCFLNRFAAGCP